jgi:hypothetical protein
VAFKTVEALNLQSVTAGGQGVIDLVLVFGYAIENKKSSFFKLFQAFLSLFLQFLRLGLL